MLPLTTHAQAPYDSGIHSLYAVSVFSAASDSRSSAGRSALAWIAHPLAPNARPVSHSFRAAEEAKKLRRTCTGMPEYCRTVRRSA